LAFGLRRLHEVTRDGLFQDQRPKTKGPLHQ